MIEFKSYESFPDDLYIKEIVYLKVNGSDPIAYCRKSMKNGNKFWACMSCVVTLNGEKKFYDAYLTDSISQKKLIVDFLEARSWESAMRRDVQMTHFEKPCTAALHQKYENAQAPAAQMSFLDDCPF